MVARIVQTVVWETTYEATLVGMNGTVPGNATVVAISSVLEVSVPYYKKVGGVKYSSSSSMMSDSPIVVCVGRILVPVLIDRKG